SQTGRRHPSRGTQGNPWQSAWAVQAYRARRALWHGRIRACAPARSANGRRARPPALPPRDLSPILALDHRRGRSRQARRRAAYLLRLVTAWLLRRQSEVADEFSDAGPWRRDVAPCLLPRHRAWDRGLRPGP